MESMNLICVACGTSLIQGIQPVSKDFSLSYQDEVDAVPSGQFLILQDSDFWKPAGHLVFNLDDLSSLPPNDKHIGYGCCGYSDCDGPNLFCFCGEGLGYQYTECCTPRMAILIPEAVTVAASEQIPASIPL